MLPIIEIVSVKLAYFYLANFHLTYILIYHLYVPILYRPLVGLLLNVRLSVRYQVVVGSSPVAVTLLNYLWKQIRTL